MGLDLVACLLIVAGVLLVLVGVGLMLAPRLPFLGRLPGDIVIHGRGFSVYVPIATSIILSLLLTIVLNIIVRLFGK